MLTQTRALLADLFASLEAEGFALGTGKYLQVLALLERLPDDLPAEELRTLLAPLLVRNAEQQERFYELFEQSRQRVAVKLAPSEPAPPQRDTVAWWRNIVLGLLVVLGLVGARLLKDWLFPPVQPITTQYFDRTVSTGDTLVEYIPLRADDSLRLISFCDGQDIGGDSIFGRYFLNPPDTLTYAALDSVGFADLCVLAVYAGREDTLFYRIAITPPPAQEADPPPPPTKDTSALRLEALPLPHPRNIADLVPDPQRVALAEFYGQYAWLIKLGLVLLITVLILAILQWRERRRRKLVAEIEAREEPPYVWQLELDSPAEIYWGDAIKRLLNQLRRRERADLYQLDVPATVGATIRSGGRIDFQYVQRTRPPEYLLLIDRRGPEDHRAHFFDQLYEAFRASEVHVARYFFSGDPRVCFNEEHTNGVRLQELQQRYGESRLLILGSGYGLLSPLSGRLARWKAVFAGWKNRAVLTPVPTGGWGRREQSLRELFLVLPATLQGLYQSVNQFDSLDPAPYSEVLARIEDAPQEPVHFEGDLLTTLRRHFEEPMVRWIAACAVYPRLYWDLTLLLGNALSDAEHNLLALSNILQLLRLPWFAEGRIPDAVRGELIHYLRAQNLETSVRKTIRNVLAQAPGPATDSAAFSDYRMAVILNELMLQPTPQQRRALEDEFARYLAAGYEPDFVTFKYLDRESTPLDFLVPDRWKKYVHPSGRTPWFGGGQDWKWALPVWLVLAGFFGWFTPDFAPCDGIMIQYQDLHFCINNTEELFIFLEHQVKNQLKSDSIDVVKTTFENGMAIARKGWSTEDTILKFSSFPFNESSASKKGGYFSPTNHSWNALKPTSDTVAFIQNIATLFFNRGLEIGRKPYADSFYLKGEISVSDDQGQPLILLHGYNPAGCDYYKIAGDIDPELKKRHQFIYTSLISQCHRFENPLDPAIIEQLFQDPGLPASSSQEPRSERSQSTTLEIFTDPRTRRMGLRDKKSRKIIARAQYNNIERDPATGWYRVQSSVSGNLLFGYLDEQGRALVPVAYRSLGFLRSGRIRAEKDLYGYLDRSGEMAIAFRYERAQDFDGTRARVTRRMDGRSYTYSIDTLGYCRVDCPPPMLREMVGHYLRGSSGQRRYVAGVLKSYEDQAMLLDAIAANFNDSPSDETISSILELYRDLITDLSPVMQQRVISRLNELPVDFLLSQKQLALIAQIKSQANISTSEPLYIRPKMTRIPGGDYRVGGIFPESAPNETPVHPVQLSDFYLGAAEITFAEYEAFCEATRREKPAGNASGRGNYPVVNVSWYDAIAYCNWLSEQMGYEPVYTTVDEAVTANWNANGFRLPTEAEWEFAARATGVGIDAARGGGEVRFGNGENTADPEEINFNGNIQTSYSIKRTGPSQQIMSARAFPPNSLGLFEMSGNVAEWCWDYYDAYRSGRSINPTGPLTGGARVVRGGSFNDGPSDVRTTHRRSLAPYEKRPYVGFRLARSAESGKRN